MESEHRLNFITNNTVYIHGDFDESIVGLLPEIQSIIDTQKTLKEGKIIFDINSSGGWLDILINLINLIEKAKKEGVIVETVVQDTAESCGSILACSGTIGHRYISEYAEHLCHYPMFQPTKANATQMLMKAERFSRRENHIKEMYKKYCEPTAQEGYITKLFDNMKNDFFIPAKECIKYGLADKVL